VQGRQARGKLVEDDGRVDEELGGDKGHVWAGDKGHVWAGDRGQMLGGGKGQLGDGAHRG